VPCACVGLAGKDRVGGGWEDGGGEERDRDVGVGGEATCCRERTTRRPEGIYGDVLPGADDWPRRRRSGF
jgi:hypothetical protein